MNFILQRYSDNSNSTQGILLEKTEGKPAFLCHVLEDEHRDVKVSKETRIPAKLYELKIRREDTPLTKKHRESYGPWFEYHIEIANVPNFTGVYIHAGNKESHTEGCLLLNDTANNNTIEAGDMARSVQAVKRFYEKVYHHLASGKRAWLEIRDESYLLT